MSQSVPPPETQASPIYIDCKTSLTDEDVKRAADELKTYGKLHGQRFHIHSSNQDDRPKLSISDSKSKTVSFFLDEKGIDQLQKMLRICTQFVNDQTVS